MPDDWGDGRLVRNLSAPFPLTEGWLWEDDPRPYEQIEPLLDPVFNHGSVVLGTDGCGMYWHLIVTGRHRGHIWNISGEGAVPFGAEFGYTPPARGLLGGYGTGHLASRGSTPPEKRTVMPLMMCFGVDRYLGPPPNGSVSLGPAVRPDAGRLA